MEDARGIVLNTSSELLAEKGNPKAKSDSCTRYRAKVSILVLDKADTERYQ